MTNERYAMILLFLSAAIKHHDQKTGSEKGIIHDVLRQGKRFNVTKEDVYRVISNSPVVICGDLLKEAGQET